MGRNLTPEAVPSAAGCNLVGMMKQVGGLWKNLVVEENGRDAVDARVGSLPVQPTLTAVSLPLCRPPPPALLSSCRTTSLFLTSQTLAAIPRPQRPPRPPRQRPRSLPVPRRLLPYTLLRSAQGSRRTSTCQVPPCLGSYGGGGALGSCQSHFRTSPCVKAMSWKHMD